MATAAPANQPLGFPGQFSVEVAASYFVSATSGLTASRANSRFNPGVPSPRRKAPKWPFPFEG